jgi:hypothetical protein
MIDWSTVVTGAVGVAGIAGTIWAAKIASKSATSDLKLSISAENERARLAEKRRIYVAYLSSTTRYSLTSGTTQIARESGQKLLSENQFSEHTAALVALGNSLGEVRLIAPQDVGVLADQLSGVLIHPGAHTQILAKRGETLRMLCALILERPGSAVWSNPSPLQKAPAAPDDPAGC